MQSITVIPKNHFLVGYFANYDNAKLDQKNLRDIALQDLSLLNDVVRNKMTYFPAKWASYELAAIGSLRIYPNESFIDHLKQDYRKMVEMFLVKPLILMQIWLI
jgi:hypothetical protein